MITESWIRKIKIGLLLLDDLYSSAVTDQCPKVLLVRKGTFDSYKLNAGEQLDLELEVTINTVIDGLGKDSIFF